MGDKIHGLNGGNYNQGAFASITRGFVFGGRYPGSPSAFNNAIEFITMSTLGNSADFGDLIMSDPGQCGGASNAVRGIFSGDTSIDYITIATLGDSTDFGDLSADQAYCSNASSPTRAIFARGTAHPGITPAVYYVQIATTGDTVDFGDLTSARLMRSGACSNGHGGLG